MKFTHLHVVTLVSIEEEKKERANAALESACKRQLYQNIFTDSKTFNFLLSSIHFVYILSADYSR